MPTREPTHSSSCIPTEARSAGDWLLDDSELVERARAGDLSAYEALIRRYQEIAFRTAYLITGEAADAEEVAQDAFVKAHRALHRFRPGAPFRPWLLQIVANEARNRRKAQARRAALTLRAAQSQGPGDGGASPEMAVLANEQRALLLRAVDELRDDDRRVIAFRYFLDLPEAEMAVALGVARGTVKSRLSRALGRLRRLVSVREGLQESRDG